MKEIYKNLLFSMLAVGMMLGFSFNAVGQETLDEPFRSFGYESMQRAVLSPDGLYFLTQTVHGEVYKWDIETGEGSLFMTGVGFWQISISSDGSKVVGSVPPDIVVWDANTQDELLRLDDAGGYAILSRDASKIVSTDRSKIIQIWDATSGDLIQSIPIDHPVMTLDTSPDGNQIVAGEYDPNYNEINAAKLWDANTGELLQSFNHGELGGVYVKYSPDGSHVFTHTENCNHENQRVVKMWNIISGEEINNFVVDPECVDAFNLSSDGSILVTGSTFSIRLWDTSTGEEIKRFDGHRSFVYSVYFFPDDTKILSATNDQTIRIWDIESGNEIKRFDNTNKRISVVAISPDNKYILAGDGGRNSIKISSGIGYLWDVESGNKLYYFDGDGDFSFSQDGSMFLASTRDETYLYETETGNLIHTFDGAKGIFTPDQSKVLILNPRQAILSSGNALLWDIATGDLIQEFEKQGKFHIQFASFIENGEQLITASHDVVSWWNTTTGELFGNYELEGYLYVVELSPDGNWMYVSSNMESGTFRLFQRDGHDWQERQVVSDIPYDYILSATFSPDSDYILMMDLDHYQIWDIENQRFKQRTNNNFSSGGGAFSEDGQYIVTGNRNGNLWIWKVETSSLVPYWKKF